MTLCHPSAKMCYICEHFALIYIDRFSCLCVLCSRRLMPIKNLGVHWNLRLQAVLFSVCVNKAVFRHRLRSFCMRFGVFLSCSPACFFLFRWALCFYRHSVVIIFQVALGVGLILLCERRLSRPVLKPLLMAYMDFIEHDMRDPENVDKQHRGILALASLVAAKSQSMRVFKKAVQSLLTVISSASTSVESIVAWSVRLSAAVEQLADRIVGFTMCFCISSATDNQNSLRSRKQVALLCCVVDCELFLFAIVLR